RPRRRDLRTRTRISACGIESSDDFRISPSTKCRVLRRSYLLSFTVQVIQIGGCVVSDDLVRTSSYRTHAAGDFHLGEVRLVAADDVELERACLGKRFGMVHQELYVGLAHGGPAVEPYENIAFAHPLAGGRAVGTHRDNSHATLIG